MIANQQLGLQMCLCAKLIMNGLIETYLGLHLSLLSRSPPSFCPSGGYPTVGVCEYVEEDAQDTEVHQLPSLWAVPCY